MRVRALFLGVIVFFLLQHGVREVWSEPYPGLLGPRFADPGRADFEPKPRTKRKGSRKPQLVILFADGNEETVSMKSFVSRPYHKQKSRWIRAFWKRMEDPHDPARTSLVEWVEERIEAVHPGRTAKEIRGIRPRASDSSAAKVLWTIRLDRV